MAPPGPLDRWLKRAPLQPAADRAAASSEQRYQQTAEPPSSSERQQQDDEDEQQEQHRPGGKGTLHAYFVWRDGSDSSSSSLEEFNEQPRKRRHTLL